MMKRKTKRALSMVLASSMMLSVSSYTAFAADYKDTVGHWSEKQVNLWSDYGVISGYDGLFRPDDSITRGEMAVIMDKVMKYQVKAENTFSDLDQNFYTDSVLKANQAGIMRGSDGAVRPKDNITREEASVLICQAFGIDPIETATSKFNDSDKVSTWAAGYVNALLQKGYISGKGDNNFDPQGNITRGEAVTMFNNIVKGFYHQAGTYTENITGNVVVNTPETVLKDMSVTGDIFVTQGVADGNLTLENVKAPTVIVRGGGVNSVKITGNSEIGTVKVEKQDGDVRVVTDGTAKVSNVYIKDGSKNSVLEGNMDKIQVDASNSTVRITNATIKELNVTKESAKVVLDEKSIVDKLTIAETAANASVEINGTAKQVIVSAPNAILTTTKTAKVDTLTVTEKATNAKLELGGTITTVETSAQGTSINVAAGANITTIKALEKAADSKMTIAGKVGTILVDAPNVTIEVLKGGEVTTIESSATATGLIVKGEGKVSTIKVGGNNSKIDISGAKVIVGKDVTGTLVMGKEVKGGSTVTTGSDKTVTDGEIENPNGNQFVNPDNPNDEWNEDSSMPQKAPDMSWFETTNPDRLSANDDGGALKLVSTEKIDTMTKLEYMLVQGYDGTSDSDFKDCGDVTELTGLKAGSYSIRFKKGGNYLTGKESNFTIEEYTVDRSGLEEYIKQVEEITKAQEDFEKEGGVYKPSSWEEFTKLIAEAKEMPEDTQEEIEAKRVAYENAIAVLVEKSEREAPPVTAIQPTKQSPTVGYIDGTTTEMEYRAESETEYKPCIDGQVEVPAPGTYYVRYKYTDDFKPSPEAQIVIEEYTEKVYQGSLTATEGVPGYLDLKISDIDSNFTIFLVFPGYVSVFTDGGSGVITQPEAMFDKSVQWKIYPGTLSDDIINNTNTLDDLPEDIKEELYNLNV